MPIILAVVLIIGAFLTGGAIQENIQQSQPPTPTPFQEIQVATPSPTFTPTSTSKPVVKGVTTKSSPTIVPPSPKPTEADPIVKCQSQSGSIEMRRSECRSMVDCQLGDSWIIMKKEDCKKAQNERVANYVNSGKNKEKSETVAKISTPTPCICIESWGAGGFLGLCKGKENCVIKYSCLLPDKKRLGVWNDDQTVCLEEHVRYAGGQSQVEGQSQTGSGEDCRRAKVAIDEERNRRTHDVNTSCQQRRSEVEQDYASRGLYESGERRRAVSLVEIACQDSLQNTERDYNSQLSDLRARGCSF